MKSKEMIHKYLNMFKASSRNYSKTFESKMFNAILKDLDRLEKLEKIIRDYCYIDNFDEGEIVRMCCESYEESNSDDFVFLKGVLDNEKVHI